MEINNLSNLNNFIKNALDYYDNTNIKYFKYINYKSNDNEDHIKNLRNSKLEGINNNIIIFNINNNIKTSNFELLGIFDNINHIWIWSWVLPDIPKHFINIVINLLEYGLKINVTNNTQLFFIKTLLTNSRILIESYIELENNLAIILYLLKNKILFIYKDKKKDKNYNITFFYLIKDLN